MRSRELVLIGVAALLASGCLTPAVPKATEPNPVQPKMVGDLLVAARTPRNVAEDVFEFSIRIVAPDGNEAKGTVGSHPVPAEKGILERTVLESGCSSVVTGDFQCEDPQRVSPYPYVRLEHVEYNGTWTIEVKRTQNRHVILPSGPDSLRPTNACVHFLFSEPGGDLRVFSGARAWSAEENQTREKGLSAGRIEATYWSNVSVLRAPDDTCGR